MNLNYNFGESLSAYLNKNRLTKLWLAQKLNVSHQTIDTYCNTRSPRQKTIDKILGVLGITLEELYKYSSDETIVNEDDVKYSKEPTVNISVEQFQYFMEAVKERDALKQKEIEKLQEQNQGVTPQKVTTA